MKEMLMGANDLLGPVLAQIGLTFAVWFYLFYKRLPVFLKSKLPNSEMVKPGILDSLPDDLRFPADNFKNLAEVPILFYAACFAAMISGFNDDLTITLAWVFVGVRAVHSLIQVSYNRVMHRFAAYMVSSLALFVMWVRMAFEYFGG